MAMPIADAPVTDPQNPSPNLSHKNGSSGALPSSHNTARGLYPNKRAYDAIYSFHSAVSWQYQRVSRSRMRY